MSDTNDITITLTLRVPEAVRESIARKTQGARALLGYGARFAGAVAIRELRTVLDEARSPEVREAFAGIGRRLDSIRQRASVAVAHVNAVRTPEPPDPRDMPPEDDEPAPHNPRGER